MRELRQVVRTFRREPAFVAGVTLTFSLAIGANASMVGLLNRLLFAPPAGITNPEGVFQFGFEYGSDGGQGFAMSTTSYPGFRIAQSLSEVFPAVAAIRTDSMTVGEGEAQGELAGVAATGTYFDLLGVRPARGRLFGPSDDEPPAGNDVVVLSWSYWQRRFAGAPSAIGSRLVLDGQALTIIGVAPRGFNGTGLASVDAFVPFRTAARAMGSSWWNSSGMRILTILGRPAPGVTPAAAASRATVVFRGEEASGRPVTIRLQSIVPGRGARASAQGRIALALTAVSLAVLLIATANVGTLMRLRAARRRTESAVRVALGARPVHLTRRALLESLLLAVAGAAGGLVLARWFDAIVRVTLLPHLAPDESYLDVSTLAAALGLSLVAGLVAGLMPLRSARRLNVIEHLRAGPTSGTSAPLRGQHVLIALQVALTTVLLVDAGLFVRSLDRVRAQDLGFSTAQLLLVDLEFQGRLGGPERDMAHHEAVRRLSQLPGVRRATVVQGMPFSSHNIPPISIPGYQLPPPDVSQLPILYAATPEYLQMMGVTLIRGRLIAERDGPGAPLVVLVNESMARTVWRDQDPIGRCVRAGHGGLPGEDPMVGASYLPCREVIGVVRDSRARSLRTGNGEARLMQYYVPFAQLPPMPFPDAAAVHAVLVETHGPPRAMIGPVRRLIQGTSTRPVLARARPYQELIDPQLRTWRLGATLFSALGVLALAIAAVGLYAAIAYLAGQRTREIGLRMALGGSRRDAVGLVVRDGLRLAVTGTAAGVVIAVLTAPLLRDLLFETSPRDPVILVGAVVTLLLVAVVAAVVPSVRASRVSPMVALRIDG